MPNIVVDSRERKPWTFQRQRIMRGWTTEVRRMRTADYAIGGCGEDFLIERKGAATEFAQNLQDGDLPRFRRELIRLRDCPHAHVILEFERSELRGLMGWRDTPFYLDPNRGVRRGFYAERFAELEAEFPTVQWHFAEDRGRAERLAVTLIDEYLATQGNAA